MFNKKYKKGMADAAKAYEAFGQKQVDALNHILEEVRNGNAEAKEQLGNLSGNIDNLYKYIESKQKAELYTVCTPFDIKDLGDEERLFLVGALFRLAMDKAPNENQQNYLRAIQKYLDIKDPPMDVNPLAVDNIEDLAAQKAILQAVIEFLRLQDGDSYDETELQQEFLDAFSVNNKGRQAIIEQIELICKATGEKGLAEKYGYVPEGATDDSEETTETGFTEDKAHKAYIFTGGTVEAPPEISVAEWIETSNYILARKWDMDSGVNQKWICIFNKKTGNEEKLTYANNTLVSASWNGTYSFEDSVLVVTDDNSLYYIDINSQRSVFLTHLDLKYDRCINVIGLNEQYIVMRTNDSKVVIIDWDGHQIFSSDSSGNEWAEHDIFFYNGFIWSISDYAGTWTLYKFSCQTKHAETVLKTNNEFRVKSFKVYDDQLYILSSLRYDRDEYGHKLCKISRLNLNNPTDYKTLHNEVVIYDDGSKNIVPYLDGWVFIGERLPSSTDLILFSYSCETNQVKELARGCGTHETETHLFKKDTHYCSCSSITIIDRYAIFRLGSRNIGQEVMLSIDDPSRMVKFPDPMEWLLQKMYQK